MRLQNPSEDTLLLQELKHFGHWTGVTLCLHLAWSHLLQRFEYMDIHHAGPVLCSQALASQHRFAPRKFLTGADFWRITQVKYTVTNWKKKNIFPSSVGYESSFSPSLNDTALEERITLELLSNFSLKHIYISHEDCCNNKILLHCNTI